MDEQKVRTLGDEIAVTMAAIDVTEHKLLGLLRDFDAIDGWAAAGQTSFAAWLSWRCGIGKAAARERVRVARALGDLPVTDAAFASGEISYSKARAITRVANAENEAVLVQMARGMTAAEIEKLSSMMRSANGEGADAEPRRRFSQRTDANGMVRMTITMTADEAALVVAALDACARTPNRRAEGLIVMAETSARGSAVERSPTEVILHVSADDLSAMTDDGRALSAEASRRLLCDAGVVAMIRDAGGATLDVGRKTRTIPSAIRRAIAVRDRGCRFPGCHHVIVDGHHIDHWCNGGETVLGNLVSLWRLHHRFVHEGGGQVEVVNGEFVFRSPGGETLEHAPRAPRAWRCKSAALRGRPSPRTSSVRSTGTASPTPSARRPSASR